MYASEDIWEPDEEFETAVCRTSRRTVPISPLRPAQITHEDRLVLSSRVRAVPSATRGPPQPPNTVLVHARALPRPVSHADGPCCANLSTAGGEDDAYDHNEVEHRGALLPCMHALLSLCQSVSTSIL